MVAWCSRHTNPIFFHIKYESILTHKCSTHENFISSIKFLDSQAVLVLLMSVEILAGVPFQWDFSIVGRVSMEIQNRKAHEIEQGAFFEIIFIIFKTDWVRWLLNPFTFAIVSWVLQAKPIKMYNEHCKEFLRDICKGGAWINYSYIEFFTAEHVMIVHRYTFQIEFVSMCLPYRYPGDVFRNLTLSIVASNLEITSIFPKA